MISANIKFEFKQEIKELVVAYLCNVLYNLCLVYIFLAEKWVEHMCRSVISLHPCNKSHSYIYLEFFSR